MAYTLLGSRQKFYFDKNLSSSKIVSSNQTQSPHINFNFSWKPIVRKWLYDSRRHRMIFCSDHYPQAIFKCFQISDFSIIRDRKSIMKELTRWPIPKNTLEDVIMHAEEAIQGFMRFFAPLEHNVFCLDLQVTHYIDRVFVPRDDLDVAAQRSIEESGPGMVPASDESIISLERKKIKAFDLNRNCVICLEELSDGCEAVCMPCDHVFHGDCIEEWLKTSHYCPICRFEMPTN